MELRSVKINLAVSDDQLKSLKETSEDCSKIFQLFVGLAIEHKSCSYMTLHKHGYEKGKVLCPNLPTAILQQVAKTALACVKSWNSNNPKKKWKYKGRRKSNTINLNKLSLSRRGQLTTISTNNKRIRVMHSIPQWFIDKYDLKNNNVQAGQLKIIDDKVILSMLYEVEIKEPVTSGETVGIDRGLYNLCVTSEGEFVNSQDHIAIKRKYQFNRSKLQQKGTKSAKRKLKTLAGKEKRFMLDVNHRITKKLASASNVKTYVLENLTGICSKRKGKKLNSWLSNWSFYQFERQLEYKCLLNGISVEYVNPAHTSQKCSSCGNIDKSARHKGKYICKVCGVIEHADLNAAYNIRNKYLKPCSV